MNIRTSILGILLLSGLSNPTSAEIVTLSFSGRVGAVYGPAAPTGVAVNDAFVGQLVFDTANATTPFPDTTVVQGGSFDGTPSPLVSASLQIGGRSFVVPTGSSGLYACSGVSSCSPPTFAAGTSNPTGETGLSVSLTNPGIASLPSVSTPFSYAGGFASFYTFTYDDQDNFTGFELYASLDRVTFSVASAVPEPSSWAMMALGFAGVGYMTCRRKAAALAA
jgi:hypothetical protein